METSFILDGAAYGSVASRLLASNMNPLSMRPWWDKDPEKHRDAKPFITVNTGRTKFNEQTKIFEPVYEARLTNAPAVLLRDEWKIIDEAVLETMPLRLMAFADIRARSQTIRIPGGMGKTVLEWSTAGGISPATTSMDPVREGDNDRIHRDITGMPLPVIHKDFFYTARDIAVSRQSAMPIDTTHARLAAEQVALEIEKLTFGLSTFAYSGYNLYGYTNLPQRQTQSITAPSSSNHATTISELLAMKKKLTDRNYLGPYVLYVSPGWDLYLDEDYSATKGENTLRNRIMAIEGIAQIKVSPYLTGNTVLMVQLTPNVARAVVGMDIVTLQWEEKGGMELHFKVMAILLPNIRSDADGYAGIVHGS